MSTVPTSKTITIKEDTKGRLDFIKVHPRETYDDIIKRLLDDHDKE